MVSLLLDNQIYLQRCEQASNGTMALRSTISELDGSMVGLFCSKETKMGSEKR